MDYIASMRLGAAEFRGAFLLSKNELAALLSTAGPKRARPDERTLWMCWAEREVIASDRTIIIRASMLPRVDVETPIKPSPVLAEELKAAAKGAKASHTIVIARGVAHTIIAVVETAALLIDRDNDSAHTLEDMVHVDLLPPDGLVTSPDRIRAELEGDPEQPPASHFAWSLRYTSTLEKVAKVAGKGESLVVWPPLGSGPFVVSVTVDDSTAWQVAMMPMDAADG